MAAQSGKNDKAIAAVMDEVRNVDLVQFPEAWNELDVLSSHTRIDAIEVDRAGVTLSDKDFQGVANVYVVLEYGDGAEPDGFTTSDAFLAKFKGHFDDQKKPVVDEFTVDTSPFFAGEEAVG